MKKPPAPFDGRRAISASRVTCCNSLSKNSYPFDQSISAAAWGKKNFIKSGTRSQEGVSEERFPSVKKPLFFPCRIWQY